MNNNERNERNEVNGMTNEQFCSILESILAFAEETRDIDKVIELLRRMQGKKKELTPATK